jgi:hypothetical protein
MWVVYALIFVVFLYAVKTLHEAPKTVPPQWKKYQVNFQYRYCKFSFLISKRVLSNIGRC